jgi:hypothetical protein
MSHSARWRAKAMFYVRLSRIADDLGMKRRCLELAAKCMLYSVRLAHRPA